MANGWVWVPEFGLVVFVVEQDAVVAVGVLEAAECVVAGCVVAASAGRIAGGVFLGCAPGATVDVDEDDGVALVDELLWKMELVERLVAGRVVQLPEEGLDLLVGGVVGGDEGEGVGGLVEELEGWWWDGGVGWVLDWRINHGART